ncbi:response regulator [Maridesulfovibrio ferrireducens]|uniref:response regulator n=1 Tax=Maridesulfovibrio ferrireducens TaxID=246191 RepID=UPI001A24DACB|nr:response regulator [Maridesulfovibrio ferrireducens]MBI9110755.1 response regulator [Maridesulfovibrio ferrireducens]
MKFLIADDNELHRELITKTIQNHGKCHIVSDGNEAVKAFTDSLKKNDFFSAIFIKSKIGSMDGPHALRKIREIEQKEGLELSKEIPIIMTVLDDEEQISETYLRGNSTSFIIKPLTKDKIVEEMTLFGLL